MLTGRWRLAWAVAVAAAAAAAAIWSAAGGGDPDDRSVAPAAGPTASSLEGEWWRHGFRLDVGADGVVAATYRIYRWCEEDPTAPCDSFGEDGSTIRSGGMWRAEARSPAAGAELRATIVETTDPQFPVGSEVVLRARPDGKVLLGETDVLCSDATVDRRECGA